MDSKICKHAKYFWVGGGRGGTGMSSGGGGIGAWGSFPPLTYHGLTRRPYTRLLWVLPGPFRVASHFETPK